MNEQVYPLSPIWYFFLIEREMKKFIDGCSYKYGEEDDKYHKSIKDVTYLSAVQEENHDKHESIKDSWIVWINRFSIILHYQLLNKQFCN